MRKQPSADRLWNILYEFMVASHFTIVEDAENQDLITIESPTLNATKINGDNFASTLINWYTEGVSLTRNEIEQLIKDNSENI